MNIFDDLFLLQRIDHLIRTRATGTPRALASRLAVSECSVYRMLDRLKSQGFPIAYDKTAGTYYYSNPVKWHVEFIVGSDKLISINGGEKRFSFLSKLSFFDSADTDFCSAVQIL